MLVFNKPLRTGNEETYLLDVLNSGHFSGDGKFTKRVHKWFQKKLDIKKSLLTTSCSSALDMSALLFDIQKGDEVIMPSFTFSSSANSFASRGAKIMFIDVQPSTMNIDVAQIEQAITKKTKAIVPMHYAGVACDMDPVLEIARHHQLLVVEDAAQAILAQYKHRNLGTLGDLGCFSFHETKNIGCGEGGLLALNNESFSLRAEIIREKGTNRTQFFRGEVEKYTWVDLGSSYLPNEFTSALLYTQLEHANKITANRLASWNRYKHNLQPLAIKEKINLPTIPPYATHNAHIFYIKTKSARTRSALIQHLRSKKIHAVFHYIPLHSSPAGKKYGEFCGKDTHTTKESNRLIRLPLYYNLEPSEIDRVCEEITAFYNSSSD